MPIITTDLADVTVRWRRHKVEIPEECPRCGQNLDATQEEPCALRITGLSSQVQSHAKAEGGILVDLGRTDFAPAGGAPLQVSRTAITCECGHVFAHGVWDQPLSIR